MSIDPDDPKVRWAMFGRQVEHFLESDVGRFLVNRAKDETEAALEEFKDADPFNGPAMAKIQARAKLSDSIVVWLGDAIAAGENATEQLKIEQAEGL
jgi:hypothetical protein